MTNGAIAVLLYTNTNQQAGVNNSDAKAAAVLPQPYKANVLASPFTQKSNERSNKRRTHSNRRIVFHHDSFDRYSNFHYEKCSFGIDEDRTVNPTSLFSTKLQQLRTELGVPAIVAI